MESFLTRMNIKYNDIKNTDSDFLKVMLKKAIPLGRRKNITDFPQSTENTHKDN